MSGREPPLGEFGLEDHRSHALAQTIAAERLEGWRPEPGQLRALAALAAGAVTVGDYLAPELAALPRPRRTPMLARSRPYLIRGTPVLRNSFGVTDAAALARLEFVATAARILAVHLDPGPAAVDVRALHRRVFGDVYPWAGEPRIVNLGRGTTTFGSWRLIPERLVDLGADVADLAAVAGGLDDGELSFRLARIYADYNQIHPFRDGNGRTGTLALHLLAAAGGRRLDLSGLSRADWVAASRDAMPFRRDGRADPRPFIAVLKPRLRPVSRPCRAAGPAAPPG